MHIPSGTTATVELERFEPALEAALQPSAEYDVARWLYVPNTYSEYRYILGTRKLENFESEFVTKLYDMGLQQILDINQKYYDQWLENAGK
jgi:hypothetical protein